ncbi:MAG: phage tail sheath subtilisin-like domain-containing protein [Chloroflexota bacterium]|nr:phage tail sheath subtilisin-like domain-containing protein [Chloroflexota bacterium]
MTVGVSYPGVYLSEVQSQSHTIPGVTTSDTAFVDIFPRGPVNVPTRVGSFGEFTATFGGLTSWSRASYGIYQYFLNGGSRAWVVRVAPGPAPDKSKSEKSSADDSQADKAKAPTTKGTTTPPAPSASVDLKDFKLEAISPGSWGNSLRAATQDSKYPPGGDSSPKDGAGKIVIDLVVQETATNPATGDLSVVASEVYRNLSLTPGDPNYVEDVIAHKSSLVQVLQGSVTPPAQNPKAAPYDPTKDITSSAAAGNSNIAWQAFTEGSDVTTVAASDLIGDPGDPEAGTHPTGMNTLAHIAPNVFNILCLPAVSQFDPEAMDTWFTPAYKFCEDQRAFLLVDTPATWDGEAPAKQLSDLQTWFGTNLSNKTDHAAVYFPRLTMPDPTAGGRPVTTEVSGTLAGIFASTDSSRGTWKAPAGTLAVIAGANPAFDMLDSDNGQLNEQGMNALRTFPVYGSVVWGARTARGADQLESEWKYVPVRRLALYIEDSLFQGTKWAVFEPNGETLWSSLRLSVGAFMQDLYRQGAFAGTSAKDAYFVQCDATTTSATDQANGIVNVLVGFAPLYPAEFVVLQISQIAAS